MDIFRVFDSLNYLPNLKVAMEAVNETHGVCEAAIARRIRPVRAALAAPAAEREALDTLRAIETVGWAARAARIHARVSAQAAEWLELDPVGWKDQLAGRIGARWTIEGGAPGKPEVWSA